MVVRMKSAVSKCCCCGECNGRIGCCVCTCKTLCFSAEGSYETFGKQADWEYDRYQTVLVTDKGYVDVSITFGEDSYGRCTVIASADGEEVATFVVGEDIECDNLTGSFPTSIGVVNFTCVTRINPQCSTCDCLCECVCVTVTDTPDDLSTYQFAGKLCWGTDRYSGTIKASRGRGPIHERHVEIVFRAKNSAPGAEYEYNGDVCEVIAIVDGVESLPVEPFSEDCTRDRLSLAISIFDEDNRLIFVVEANCAECYENCEMTRCCPDRTCPYDGFPNPLPEKLKLQIRATFPTPGTVTPPDSGFSPPANSDCYDMEFDIFLIACEGSNGAEENVGITYGGFGVKECTWCSLDFTIRVSVTVLCAGQGEDGGTLSFEAQADSGDCPPTIGDQVFVNFQQTCDPILMSGDLSGDCIACPEMSCQIGAIVRDGVVIPVIATHAPFCLSITIYESP